MCHKAIEEASAGLMAPSSYKTYLEQHMPAINASSVEQDRRKMGPGHFLNLEDAQGEAVEETKIRQRFDTVDLRFTKKGETAKKADFKTKPLQAADLETFQNVYKETMKQYRLLVGLLKQVKPGLGQAQKDKLNQALETTTGALTHYIGDLHQPLHATSYHTWVLAYSGKGNAHRYMETKLLTKSEYAAWQASLSGTAPAALSETQVGERLLRQLEQSYLKIYPMVAAERKIRGGFPTPDVYFQELQQAWKPVIEDRLTTCAQSMADILNSAWVAAGKPDLSALNGAAGNTAPHWYFTQQHPPAPAPHLDVVA